MLTTRAATPADDVPGRMSASWGSPLIAVHGRLFDATELPALVALGDDAALVGWLTYEVGAGELEVVSCDADPPGRGTGAVLVRAAIALAREQALTRVVCTTTNDNLPALGFWQAQGFRVVAWRPDAVEAARRLKPSIPRHGHRDLPIRDEIDLALGL